MRVKRDEYVAARGRGTGDPRGNPPTSGIVRHDLHMRKSVCDPRRESNPVRIGPLSPTLAPYLKPYRSATPLVAGGGSDKAAMDDRIAAMFGRLTSSSRIVEVCRVTLDRRKCRFAGGTPCSGAAVV
ncbi:hypothetical protein PR048_030524 [Dryococelus australis]|uniref:Uncharacterized protein n=1 Tax=Dryococelus australis TaxID=614101 RepID=A0ABQ9G9P4_9NEOP|nr:hypothetical protein PR048_030524 [Dryococelus australis]